MKDKKAGCSLSLTTMTAVFVVLKLTGVIDWQWKWVLLPTLIEIALIILALLLVHNED